MKIYGFEKILAIVAYRGFGSRLCLTGILWKECQKRSEYIINVMRMPAAKVIIPTQIKSVAKFGLLLKFPKISPNKKESAAISERMKQKTIT